MPTGAGGSSGLALGLLVQTLSGRPLVHRLQCGWDIEDRALLAFQPFNLLVSDGNPIPYVFQNVLKASFTCTYIAFYHVKCVSHVYLKKHTPTVLFYTQSLNMGSSVPST